MSDADRQTYTNVAAKIRTGYKGNSITTPYLQDPTVNITRANAGNCVSGQHRAEGNRGLCHAWHRAWVLTGVQADGKCSSLVGTGYVGEHSDQLQENMATKLHKEHVYNLHHQYYVLYPFRTR